MMILIFTYVRVLVTLGVSVYLGYRKGRKKGISQAVATCYKMGAHGCARKVKKELL